MSFRPLPRKWNNNMNLSVAQPSSAGLRGAYSESNLYQNDMYGGGLEEPRHYGSTPWIHDTSTMKYTAATNKYLQSTSSIFDDPRSRDSIRHQRGRQALEELKQQVAEKEAEKRREKEEEERILAAMNGPSYNPSFQEPNARRRSQGRAPVVAVDNAATVEDSGGGGYYGGLGGGYDAGGYNDEYGGYSSSGYDAYQSPQQNYYDAPQNFGRRRPQRYNANMVGPTMNSKHGNSVLPISNYGNSKHGNSVLPISNHSNLKNGNSVLPISNHGNSKNGNSVLPITNHGKTKNGNSFLSKINHGTSDNGNSVIPEEYRGDLIGFEKFLPFSMSRSRLRNDKYYY